MANGALKVICRKMASLLSGIAEDDESNDPFGSIEKHKEKLEDNQTALDDC